MNFISEPEFFGGIVDDINLLDFQEESVDRARFNIRHGNLAQIVELMCGGGKTVIGAYLLRECWQKKKRGMFVVDRLSLLSQTSRTLDRYGIPHGVIQSGHPRYRPGELIQLASIDTLRSRGWPDADLIINDEAHINHRTMHNKIAKKDAVVIGLTATPFTKGMAKHYTALVNVITGNKLTQTGVLVPFKHEVWCFEEPDMSKCKPVAGEWTEKDQEREAMKIVGSVADAYLQKGQGRKAVAFGVNVAHCEAMQREFLSAGINAALYTYRTPDEEREMLIGENGEFRKPDSSVRILISVAALSRGFDVTDIGCIISARQLKSSFTEFVQSISRGLRSHPSKKDCVMIDHAGNFNRHYPAFEEFMEEGVRELDDGKKKEAKPAIRPEKKPTKCPKCSHVFVGGPNCPACGYIFPPKKTIEHAAGELMKFDGKSVLKLDREAKSLLYSELKFVAESRGYKIGWAAWKYKAITGVWPQGMKDVESQIPRRDTLSMVEALRPTRPNRRAIEPRIADLFR